MKSIKQKKAKQGTSIGKQIAGFIRLRQKKIAVVLRENPQIPLIPLVFIITVTVWELIVWLFDIPKIIIPAPSAVSLSLIRLIQSPTFSEHFSITLTETLLGFVLGSLLGFVLGSLIAQFQILDSTLYPYIVAFQALPKVSIAPIVIVWFGFGISSKVVLTATMAFFPMLANTIAGLKASDPDQMELFSAFTASRWQIFRMLKMPMALPYIFVGLDLAILLSVTGAIVGEFVGAQGGLGYLIVRRNIDLDVAGMFAVLVILGLMGIIFHTVMQFIQRKIVFWMEPEHERIVGV